MKKYLLKIYPYIKHNELIIISGILLLFSLYLTKLLVLPAYESITNNNSEIKKVADINRNLKKKLDFLSSIDGGYYSKVLQKMGIVLPPHKDYVSLFLAIDDMQSRSDVFIQNIDFQLGIVSTQSARLSGIRDGHYSIPMRFTVNGSEQNLAEFIADLKAYRSRLITLNNITYQKVRINEVSLALDANIHYYPLPESLGSIDTPLPRESSQTASIIKAVNSGVDLAQKIEDSGNIPVSKTNLFR